MKKTWPIALDAVWKYGQVADKLVIEPIARSDPNY
jgi:hypothetical protein